LSQHLTGIRAFAGAIQRAGKEDGARVRAAACAIEASAQDIYGVSHRLMEGLRPNLLDEAGIGDALGPLLEAWGERHPEIEWRASLDRGLLRVAEPVRVAIYRIVQECLSNVAAHAGARRLRIVLAPCHGAGGPWLRLVVRDDGVGMAAPAARPGIGLLGMRERVLSLGGQFHIGPGRGRGTRVKVLLPAQGVAGES
jgi:two-component system sensor histidine kinase UhpB